MRSSLYCAIVALTLLVPAALAGADWRADLRARMAPTGDIIQELDSRGVVLSHWIGERFVELEWDGQLSMLVDNSPVADLSEWIEDDGSIVVAFAVYEGLGTLSPTGTAGLRGWVYLDDMGDVRVDLMTENDGVVYKVDGDGFVIGERGIRCKCDSGNVDGCDQSKCLNAGACDAPSQGFKCGYQSVPIDVFEAAFETLIENSLQP